jgi:hypothetical protein
MSDKIVVAAAAPVSGAATATASTTAAAAPQKKTQQHLLWLQMVAGAASGAATKTATAPLERIKIIFQVQVSARPARLVPAGGVNGHRTLRGSADANRHYRTVQRLTSLRDVILGCLAAWRGQINTVG